MTDDRMVELSSQGSSQNKLTLLRIKSDQLIVTGIGHKNRPQFCSIDLTRILTDHVVRSRVFSPALPGIENLDFPAVDLTPN